MSDNTTVTAEYKGRSCLGYPTLTITVTTKNGRVMTGVYWCTVIDFARGHLILEKVSATYLGKEPTLYSVCVADESCSCPDFLYRGGECKHLRAAMQLMNPPVQ